MLPVAQLPGARCHVDTCHLPFAVYRLPFTVFICRTYRAPCDESHFVHLHIAQLHIAHFTIVVTRGV